MQQVSVGREICPQRGLRVEGKKKAAGEKGRKQGWSGSLALGVNGRERERSQLTVQLMETRASST